MKKFNIKRIKIKLAQKVKENKKVCLTVLLTFVNTNVAGVNLWAWCG